LIIDKSLGLSPCITSKSNPLSSSTGCNPNFTILLFFFPSTPAFHYKLEFFSTYGLHRQYSTIQYFLGQRGLFQHHLGWAAPEISTFWTPTPHAKDRPLPRTVPSNVPSEAQTDCCYCTSFGRDRDTPISAPTLLVGFIIYIPNHQANLQHSRPQAEDVTTTFNCSISIPDGGRPGVALILLRHRQLVHSVAKTIRPNTTQLSQIHIQHVCRY
jgi:hypothetical protein